MKILLCHNYYQQPGGEDQVFADETRLLRSNGHEVLPYTLHNDAIQHMGSWKIAGQTIWNRGTYNEVRKLIRRQRPDLMHCHNTFPLISPSVYYAARIENVPVVQSLHNSRLLCPNGLLLRNQRICEDCLGRFISWPSVVHGCYRGSRAASAVVTAMLATHYAKKTWTRAVDRYIALTEFSRQKFISGGIPAKMIAIKPNCVDPDPGSGAGRGGYALFAGRLSPEKGIDVLLDAWSRLDGRIPLKIAGDGPLAERVRAAAAENRAITYLGRQPLAELLPLVGEAACLILPSVWYEQCPKILIESFAKGTPVLASRLGAMAELVDHGRTGLLFAPDSAEDLATAVRQLWAQLPATDMRRAARQEYEAKYTAKSNYEQLMEVYRQAREDHRTPWAGPRPRKETARGQRSEKPEP
jgi:glycosyltransferase involved in cell wall biosynthesis